MDRARPTRLGPRTPPPRTPERLPMATIQNQTTRRLDALSVRAARAFVDAGLHGVEASVVAAIDVSPPIAPLFINGHVHELATALLALGMRFDDDGVVPVWTFGTEARLVGDLKRGDHAHFVSRHVLAPAPLVPGQRPPPNRFAPLIDAIVRREFPREWAHPGSPRLREARETPVFVIVVSGGNCSDVPETMRMLRRASHLPIFWQFAAVAVPGIPSDFRFLRTVNDLPDTLVDACGFFEPQDLADEDALYAGLLNEFPRYLGLAAVQNMLLGQPASEEAVDPTDELISQTLLTLPVQEQERRARARDARLARRDERASAAEQEIERAMAVPTIAHAAERATERAASEERPRRMATATRPYREDELGTGEFPAVQAMRKSARLAPSFQIPEPTEPQIAVAPAADTEDVEDTVQTTTERLARIRARRDARRNA